MLKLLGVGGHAKVIIDAAKISGKKIDAVYDDDENTHGKEFCGYKVAGKIDSDLQGDAIIAIGNNKTRKKISTCLKKMNWETVIHPTAIIADDVEIGEGSLIMAGTIIQTGTKIGKHCIINTGACIDHDCKIADFSHIAPNCSLAGGIEIGEGTFIGIGTAVSQYLKIGEWCQIGAGAAVVSEIPSNCTAVGVPAKPTKFHNENNG